MRWFFILLPWVELFTLIRLGGQIGAFQTLLYVFVTFVLGVTIIRWQGMEVLTRLRDAQEGWVIPSQLLVDDLALGLAGLLLAIPGLVTDTLAILVLIGPVLRRLFGSASPRVPPRRGQGPRDGSSRSEAPLEGEFRRIDDD